MSLIPLLIAGGAGALLNKWLDQGKNHPNGLAEPDGLKDGDVRAEDGAVWSEFYQEWLFKGVKP